MSGNVKRVMSLKIFSAYLQKKESAVEPIVLLCGTLAQTILTSLKVAFLDICKFEFKQIKLYVYVTMVLERFLNDSWTKIKVV